MKILQIMTHPEYANEKRSSNHLSNIGLEALKLMNPRLEIEVLNIYDPINLILQVNSDILTNFSVDAMSVERLAQYHAQFELINQLRAADYIFIYMPLHNWNVPSKFKDYLDNILTAHETFKYTATGSVGLMSNDATKVTLVLTSGSEYDTNYRYVNLDITPQYMRGVLHIMGIDNMKPIRAQGLDIITIDNKAIMQRGESELTEYINSLPL